MRTVPIGDLVLPVRSWNPAKDAAGRAITYIDLGAVDNDRKEIATVQTLQGDDAPSRARQRVMNGDILISTVRPNLNGVARVPLHLDGATASTGFCVLRADTRKLSPEYLFQWVRSPSFVSDMVRKATGASYPAVSDRIVLSSEIPCPPLAEQRRIAAILDQADTLRRKRRQWLSIFGSLSQSVFVEMFGVADPNRWAWKTIRVDEAGRVQLGRQRAPKYQTGAHSHPYVRVANVYEDRIDLSDVLSMDFDEKDFKAYKLQYGDILFNEGQSTELVGRPAMWRSEIADCCFQNTLIRFQADETCVLPGFALHVFLAYFRRGEFARISSKTSSVAHLGAGRLAAMSFPLPPIDRQREFCRRNSLLAPPRHNAQVQLEKLDALFAALQFQAFSYGDGMPSKSRAQSLAAE